MYIDYTHVKINMQVRIDNLPNLKIAIPQYDKIPPSAHLYS